ncbi:MAG: diphosphate--fructose-6-phosphate 1-phosphotransferase [Tissierella sp.]|nr:diphosphate--fructose-6-phosphate 1-phosphotransferase [Tissierella sp.]
MKKNALYIQSGGPTSVINASAYGVISACNQNKDKINKLYSVRHGIIGLLNKELIDISALDEKQLELLPQTPSMIFGSSRYRMPPPDIDDTDYKKILEVLQEYNINYIFFNGGNGTVRACKEIKEYLDGQNYNCNIILIPKTVDNDISYIDHAPGFPSAARHVAINISQLAHDIRTFDTGLITTVEVMGRNTGFLAAASIMAEKDGNGPDLIYVPEVIFDPDKFVNDIKRVYEQKGKCLVVIAEGVKTVDGKYLFEEFDSRKEEDPQLNMGGISPYIYNLLTQHFTCKIRCIDLGLMQRCSAHTASKLDVDEAIALGELAVHKALNGEHGKMVSICRISNKPYKTEFKLYPIEMIAQKDATLPLHYLNEEENHITPDYLDYIEPLVGELPIYAKLRLTEGNK